MAEKQLPIVTFTLSNGKQFKAELYPDIAPNTVANFLSLVNKKFYDGTIFHRVIPGFMIQGGDPTGTGTGGPGHHIRGEFSRNGFDNALAHTLGVLSMARSGHPDSAGSQFFVMVADSPHLDGSYAAFGKVTQGIEAALEVAQAQRDNNDRPAQPISMTVTADCFGVDYPEPEVKKGFM